MTAPIPDDREQQHADLQDQLGYDTAALRDYLQDAPDDHISAFVASELGDGPDDDLDNSDHRESRGLSH